MFSLQYFNKKKLVGQFEYPSLVKAQNAIEENDIWSRSTSYKIIDVDSGDVEEEDVFEDGESIMRDMFPDEDSEEGFDDGDFFDND